MKITYIIANCLEGLIFAFLVIIGVLAPFGLLFLSAHIIKALNQISLEEALGLFNINNIFMGFVTYIGIIISITNIFRQMKAKEIEEKKRRLYKNRNIYKYLGSILSKNQKKYNLLKGDINKLYTEFLWKKLESYEMKKDLFYVADEAFIKQNLENILEIEIGEKLLELIDEVLEINEFVKESFLEFDWNKKVEKFKYFSSKCDNYPEVFREIILSEIIRIPNIIPNIGKMSIVRESEEKVIELINNSNIFKDNNELIKKYEKTRVLDSVEEESLLELYIAKIDFMSHLYLDMKQSLEIKYTYDEVSFWMEEMQIMVGELRNLNTLKEKIDSVVIKINKCSELIEKELKVANSLFPKEFR